MNPPVAKYSELWVCFIAPSGEPPPETLVLSFMSPSMETETVERWGRQFVSGREMAQEVRVEARRLYVDVIARIGATPCVDGQTLREALKGQDGYSRWWLLKVSEKDCVWDGDPTYTTLIRLLCIKRVMDKYGLKRVRLWGGGSEFHQALREHGGAARPVFLAAGYALALILIGGFLGRLAHCWLYLKLWGWSKFLPQSPTGRFDILLQAHWNWSIKLGTDGSLHDSYFRTLPGDLDRHGIGVGWLTCWEPLGTFWERNRQIYRVIAKSAGCPKVILMERYLQLFDILSSAFNPRYLLQWRRFAASEKFRELFRVERLDLYPILRNQLLRSLWGSTFFRLELIATTTRRACDHLQPKLLLTFLELFLHTRAMYAGARLASSKIKLWTAQHAGYSSDKTFGILEPDRELRGKPDGCPVPAPEGIFAMGELAQTFWKKIGYSDKQVHVTGGLRYQHVGVVERAKPKGVTPQVSVLLIVGMNEALDTDMCEAAVTAARDLPRIRLQLRDHPAYRLSAQQGFSRFRSLIEVTAGTVDEDLANADLVLFTHSGLAEEAFLLGVPTWQWLWAGFNTSIFLDLPVIPTFSSVTDLRRAMQTFVQSPDQYKPRREVQERILRQCFGPDPAHASARIADKISELIGTNCKGRESE